MVAQKTKKTYFGPTFFKQINIIFYLSKKKYTSKGTQNSKKEAFEPTKQPDKRDFSTKRTKD